MMMMVLVSKRHKLTTKYKMQATPHFSLICQSEEDIIIQKCRASRFCYRESGFSSHLPCRTSSCGNNYWGLNIDNKTTLTYFKTSLTAFLTKDMAHFNHRCIHMGRRSYANEMLIRLDRFLDENFVKLRSRFECALKKSFLG